MTATTGSSVSDGVVAGLVAAVVSGLPSTAYAFLAGRDVLEATVAAGSLPLPNETRRGRLIAAAIPTHLAISVAWGVALAAVLPRRRELSWGASAGAAIAAFDLGIIGRRVESIRNLPQAPQLADHICFGVVVAEVVRRRREARVVT